MFRIINIFKLNSGIINSETSKNVKKRLRKKTSHKNKDPGFVRSQGPFLSDIYFI